MKNLKNRRKESMKHKKMLLASISMILVGVIFWLVIGPMLTSLPNIANLLDKITGGPGTVWEDFLKVIGLGGS